MPVKIPQIPFRRQRRRASEEAPPVEPLTLVWASYSAEDVQLTLVFDRGVDIDGAVGVAVVVNDGAESGLLLDGTGGVSLIDPVTVRFDMNVIGGASGSETYLNALADNGIVAVGDGAGWAGVPDLSLPFP